MRWIKRLIGKEDIRKDAISWWGKLTDKQKEIIEKDYYEIPTKGDSTEIDIEVMYQIYCL